MHLRHACDAPARLSLCSASLNSSRVIEPVRSASIHLKADEKECLPYLEEILVFT